MVDKNKAQNYINYGTQISNKYSYTNIGGNVIVWILMMLVSYLESNQKMIGFLFVDLFVYLLMIVIILIFKDRLLKNIISSSVSFVNLSLMMNVAVFVTISPSITIIYLWILSFVVSLIISYIIMKRTLINKHNKIYKSKSYQFNLLYGLAFLMIIRIIDATNIDTNILGLFLISTINIVINFYIVSFIAKIILIIKYDIKNYTN